MTHHPIKILPDGTRIYSSYNRYKPKPLAERKYKVRKPDNPDAVRWKGDWLLPLPVLPDEDRVKPVTRPDSQTLEHKARCRCEVCRRPQAKELWRKKMSRDLKPGS